MRFHREFPLFLGWFLSNGVAAALTWLAFSPFRGKNFQNGTEWASFMLLLIAFLLLVTFLTFMVSIKNVVIPFYQKNKVVPSELGQLKLADYLFNWFACWVYAVLFSLPLMCWAVFFPEGVVNSVWRVVANYLGYRFIVKKWILEETMSQNKLTEENQTPVA